MPDGVRCHECLPDRFGEDSTVAAQCYPSPMTTAAAPVRRTDYLLYVIGIALSAPTLISLIHRQFDVAVAQQIHDFITGYRSLAEGVSSVIHAPLRAVAFPPPPPLIDLHILSFAGMGMMTRGLEAPGQKKDAWHAFVWSIAAFLLGYMLVGILVLGAILAGLIANPLKPFRSDHWIETTPLLEGPQGRLRREREMRLERDLARIMIITLTIVGGYFGLNAVMLTQG
jgi:hypothetical protein